MLLLLIFASQPVANQLSVAMELSRGTYAKEVTYDAVIVLGGILDPEASHRIGHPQYHEGVERILAAEELLRAGAARYALISGGLIDPQPGVSSEAAVLKEQL